MMVCWNAREDLREAFDLSTQAGRIGFTEWWDQNEVKGNFNTVLSTQDVNVNFIDNKTCEKKVDIYEHTKYERYSSDGINLIGLVKGELGIGEDVRMAAKAMNKANIKFSMFNFPRKSYSRQLDMSFNHFIRDELIYNVNMVNLTGFEHASLFAQFGKKIFDKRFTIGAWPWELPRWPGVCNIIYNLVDEIWASSRYAVQAYSDSPVPVIYMPMTVDFDALPEYKRNDYGLKEDTYLFLFVFDGLSYLPRKNPIAHIEAFWAAFPRSQKDVGLVIKTMNVEVDSEVWRRFHEMASTDDRITIIAETLSKDKVLGLMNSCDAFLSLHRAEGFGRCIAEMMWLGKPVIVSNFSGNTDFTKQDTAFLVDGNLVKVKKGEYPYGEGQTWYDPDINIAADHMRTCYQRGSIVGKIARAGKDYVKINYSAEAVSEKYQDRFKELGII